MTEAPISKDECLRILELHKNWNTGQRSVSLALKGLRTEEDDILDARRKLIKAVLLRLAELTEQS